MPDESDFSIDLHRQTLPTLSTRSCPLREPWGIWNGCRLEGMFHFSCYVVYSTKSSLLSKCEADLPEALRFGKVGVSCEDWSRAGDPYVLKGP